MWRPKNRMGVEGVRALVVPQQIRMKFPDSRLCFLIQISSCKSRITNSRAYRLVRPILRNGFVIWIFSKDSIQACRSTSQNDSPAKYLPHVGAFPLDTSSPPITRYSMFSGHLTFNVHKRARQSLGRETHVLGLPLEETRACS
jgi:hypothetical protein